MEEEKTEDKLKDNDTENKDVDDDYETAEKKENDLLLGRKNTPKQKEKKIKKPEDSDKDSDEEEEKIQERYIILFCSPEAPVWGTAALCSCLDIQV